MTLKTTGVILTCFVVVTSERMQKLLISLQKNRKLEIIGIVNSLDTVIKHVLPLSFRPDIVFMDYKLYEAFIGYLEPIRNNCRMLALLGSRREEEQSKALYGKFTKGFYFIENSSLRFDLNSCIAKTQEKVVDEQESGHLQYDSNGFWIDLIAMPVHLLFSDILFIRTSENLTFLHLLEATYISDYRMTNFTCALQKKWMAKAGKSLVVNLNKIHKIDLLDSRITMVNGISFIIEEDFKSSFIEKIETRLRLSPEKKHILDHFKQQKDVFH